MNFNDIKPEEYSKPTFGKCIRARREELGKTAKEVAKAIGMSPVYLSDIERGLRPAPTGANSGINYMENLIKELQIPSDEVHAFLTMAEVSSGRYEDISSYLSRSPTARVALRLADEKGISEDEWLKFIEHIQTLSSSQG